MERLFLALAGFSGAVAVGLGAYGAHGLSGWLEANAGDPARHLAWWETAVLYHLVHSVALAIAAWASGRGGVGPKVAGSAFLLGILLFAGTLYAMALGAPRFLGAVTPLGGLSLIVGWIALGLSALRKRE
jgi:uncharacterized membrane protein YgdD (TMEM256/DUF423 family)